jgi:phosphatidylserine synthase
MIALLCILMLCFLNNPCAGRHYSECRVVVVWLATVFARKLIVSPVLCYRLQVITALENVTLFPQYAPALYSIFRFVLQIFYDGGTYCAE